MKLEHNKVYRVIATGTLVKYVGENHFKKVLFQPLDCKAWTARLSFTDWKDKIELTDIADRSILDELSDIKRLITYLEPQDLGIITNDHVHCAKKALIRLEERVNELDPLGVR